MKKNYLIRDEIFWNEIRIILNGNVSSTDQLIFCMKTWKRVLAPSIFKLYLSFISMQIYFIQVCESPIVRPFMIFCLKVSEKADFIQNFICYFYPNLLFVGFINQIDHLINITLMIELVKKTVVIKRLKFALLSCSFISLWNWEL